MLIEDGTGSGKTAAVNSENRLKTIAITTTVEHHINHEEGMAFNIIFQQTPSYEDPSSDTGDICFLYLKNTDNLDICLEGIKLRLGGTGQSEIIKLIGNPSGTPVNGNSVTPSNLNLGSGKTADGTFETGNNITGLTGGTELERNYLGSSDTTVDINFEQDIIVPKNNIITLWASTTGTEIAGTLIFNYHAISAG